MTRTQGNELRALAIGIAGVAGMGFIDYATGYEVRLFPLYFLPVALVAQRHSRGAALALSALSTLTWAGSNWLAGRVYASPWTWSLNTLSQFAAFATVGVLVSELQRRLSVERGLSRLDPLTALPNRRAFYENAELLVAVARRTRRPVTIAYLDLDNFEAVNDQRGHQEGDRLLIATAEILKAQFRVSDLIARFGGDEFVVLLFDTGALAARTTLERVRDRVRATMSAQGWAVTASVGAISYDRAPQTLEHALRDVDAVMYRAKQRGRDRVDLEIASESGEDGAAKMQGSTAD